MNKIFGFARISTSHQNLERQVRNILKAYPTAKIIKETFTGTKLQGRRTFENLLQAVHKDDLIVFDSVSRLSRNAFEGCKIYEDLFNRGVEIVFLKEPQVNTSVYRETLKRQIDVQIDTGNESTNELIATIIKALNQFTINLAFEQIKKCFEQAQKEVDDLHQRTKEGLLTAKLNGKRVGNIKGSKLVTKKSKTAKPAILKYCKSFDGNLSDVDVIKLLGISRTTFYKYKRQLKSDIM